MKGKCIGSKYRASVWE